MILSVESIAPQLRLKNQMRRVVESARFLRRALVLVSSVPATFPNFEQRGSLEAKKPNDRFGSIVANRIVVGRGQSYR